VSGMLLLPGMGADARLFDAQESSLRFTVPPWPDPMPTDTLQSYAARFASVLRDPPSIVGGASFGGMVALELAALTNPAAVVLVGSCAAPDAVAPYIRMLGRAVVHLPSWAFRPRPWTSSFLLPKLGELDRAGRSLFWSMAARVPPAFLKWACSAVLGWRPTPLDVPVFHIHGDRDRLIPIGRVRPTEVVRGGGHLLSLTHPRQVTSFIAGIAQAHRVAETRED
jgi:pimeloyl-ACP methyl ester carboxylesterase